MRVVVFAVLLAPLVGVLATITAAELARWEGPRCRHIDPVLGIRCCRERGHDDAPPVRLHNTDVPSSRAEHWIDARVHVAPPD